MDEEASRVRHHLLIAGTGRSGTSFLVRYLAELGLDTHLDRFGENASWDDDANAGFEDSPLSDLAGDLPYVVKSPWLYQFIDDLLPDTNFVTDAVIVPVRDLAEAAVSRSIIERRAIHQSTPWLTESRRTWEEWCRVPGGITYSLNPIDQGRLLAVGFHHLLQRLIEADIPVILLAFPRFITDATYLYEKLRPVLPHTTDHEMACSVHLRVADPAKVRVRKEVEALAVAETVSSRKSIGYGSADAQDAIAARRELARLRKQLSNTAYAAAEVEEQRRLERQAAASANAVLLDRLSVMEARLAEAAAATEQASQDSAAMAHRFCQEMQQCRQQTRDLSEDMARLQDQLAAKVEQNHGLEAAVTAMRESRSWRLTWLYRALGAKLRAVLPM